MIKRRLGAKGLFHSPSWKEVRAGTQAGMEECYSLTCSSWFAQLLSYIYLRTFSPGIGTTHSGPGPPTSIINKKILQTCPWAILMWHFLNRSFLFLNDSGLSQVVTNKHLTRTRGYIATLWPCKDARWKGIDPQNRNQVPGLSPNLSTSVSLPYPPYFFGTACMTGPHTASASKEIMSQEYRQLNFTGVLGGLIS